MLHYLEACPDLSYTLDFQLNFAVIIFLAHCQTGLRDHDKAFLPFSHESLLEDLSRAYIDVFCRLWSAAAFFVDPGGDDMSEPF